MKKSSPLNRKKKQYLELEKEFGAREVPARNVASLDLMLRSAENPQSVISGGESWDELHQKALACRRCRLCETRNKVVFGDGNPRSGLVFVGEAPGRDEDEQGRPFVGRAGQLLTKMIEAMGLRREDIYIANCLKCRPPENRNPEPDEIALCQPILRRQIELIRPKVICALGKFAAQTLLATETPISKLRGNFHDYHGVKLMPTYHPAYLLRNPAEKKWVWEDLQKIMRELGLPLPAGKNSPASP